jgi:hypothetical protein
MRRGQNNGEADAAAVELERDAIHGAALLPGSASVLFVGPFWALLVVETNSCVGTGEDKA